MTDSLIVLVAWVTVEEKKPHPLLRAPTGLVCKSFRLGKARDENAALGWLGWPEPNPDAEGDVELPKPAYRPPFDGGKSAGRFTFACPRPAKKSSFAAFCEPAYGLDTPPRLEAAETVVEERDVDPFAAGDRRPEFVARGFRSDEVDSDGGGAADGTNGRSSISQTSCKANEMPIMSRTEDPR